MRAVVLATRILATMTLTTMALAGCGGGGGGNGGAGGTGGAGGGGNNNSSCNLTITGAPTGGTYDSCTLQAFPQSNALYAGGLPGCEGCGLVVRWVGSSTDDCMTTASVQVIDPNGYPNAVATSASTICSTPDQMCPVMTSCTVSTSSFDASGGHWSGSITAHVIAYDSQYNLTGQADVSITGSL